jgi:hypothetical protein
MIKLKIYARSKCLREQSGDLLWLFDVCQEGWDPQRYQLKFKAARRVFQATPVNMKVPLRIDKSKAIDVSGKSFREIFKSRLTQEEIARCTRAAIERR